MHDRSARIIFTILAVALVTTSFGSAAEGKRIENDGLTSPTTMLTASSDGHEWCGNLSNAPAVRAAAAGLRGIGTDDETSLDVLTRAAERPMSAMRARQVGSEYAQLADDWRHWDRACGAAYADRS